MREAMYGYSNRILQLSIVISLITAGLVYLSLQWLMVRPMRRITRSMATFQASPEDESVTIAATDRSDEIGFAQRALAAMQRQIRASLRQQARLAALGAAVAKINHDLRNSLSTAVLASDRLAHIDDPEVKKVMPRLYDAIDRAVNLCGQTLAYVRDETPRLNPVRFQVRELVAEVGTALGPPDEGEATLQWRNEVPDELEVTADRDQVFRVLSNLAVNAREAGAGTVRVSGHRRNGRVAIDVADDGPGLTPRARDSLFQPFAGSTRHGGTGLGLVIARDIMRAHGGDIGLRASGEDGTTFRLDLPARPGGRS
jgi:signal transduction histidine kinase